MEDQEPENQEELTAPLNSPDRTNRRSSSYQFIFGEVQVAPFVLASFLDHNAQPEATDQLNELKGQLMDRLLVLIKRDLTKLQSKTLLMWLSGKYTQVEIAKMLGCNQSSVAKCLYGNCTYTNGIKTNYGGCVRKLKKIVAEDPDTQNILKQIQELDL